MSITITTPTNLIPPVNKGQYIANREVHIETLSSNEFEELTYWTYKAEIIDGAWKGTYDQIHLIQASVDKARDCALYKNGKLAGVMQCKHSTVPTTKLAETVFIKEVIKFALYSIVFPNDLPIVQDFPYYIVINYSFSENCEKLIDNFRLQIDNYTDLQKYTEAVINKYTSLNGLTFTSVEKDLKEVLKKLSIKKIDYSSFKSVLAKTYQVNTVNNYFLTMPVVTKELLDPIEADLSDLKNQIDILISPPPPNRPEPIIYEGEYLTRYVNTTDNDFFAYMLGTHETLEDQLKAHRHLALIGWGQTGKSTVLRHLASILSDDQHDDHVFLIHLDDYTDKDIKDLIPRLKDRPADKVVVILDGLDEVLPQYYSTAINKIKAFTRDHQDIRTIVSCRENFYAIYATESDRNTLPQYVSLRLQELDNDTINDYLISIPGFDLNKFIQKLKEADLEELIKIPFYLIKFATEFNLSGKLIQGKSALFEELLEKGVEEAVKKQHGRELSTYIPVLTAALEHLAFALEIQAKNFFTLEDLHKVVGEEMASLIQEAGTIIFGSAENGGQWRFVHHHMQEYLAARILVIQTPELIKSVITRDTSHTILRPSWVHTISFMISLMESGNPMRQEIVDLLLNNEPGLLMEFEPENITKEIRHDIFKKLMDTAAVQDKRLHRSKFEPLKLARFSQTDDNIRYMIDLLNKPGSDIQVANALDIVAFYKLATFPALKVPLRAAVEQYLDHSEPYTRFMAIRALVQLFKLNPAEYQLLFDKFQFATDTWLRYILFHSIWQQGYAEKYLSYALTQMRQIMIEERNSFRQSTSHSTRLANENYELLNIVQSIKSEAGALEMIKFWGNNLSICSHTISFREYRTHIFKLAEDLQSASVFGQIVGYFITNLRQFAGNYSFSEVAKYFLSTGLASTVIKSIYLPATQPGWEHFVLIADLLDQQGFDFLENEAVAGRLTSGQAQILQRQIADKAKDWEVKWDAVVVQHYQIPPPLIIDHKSERSIEVKRKTAALFDRAIFKKEVGDLYAAVGKDPLKYDDLHVLDPKDRINYHVYYWIFTNLERRFDYLAGYSLQGVLHDLDLVSEISWMSKIYIFLKEQKDVKLTSDQMLFLKNWVDQQIPQLDFKASFGFLSTQGGVEPEMDPMIITSFLLRRFEMVDYPHQKYLDLLSTYRYNDQEKDVFEFVLSVCKTDDVTERVFENLATGILKYQVLVNHIDYLLGRELTDGADLLVPYLTDKDTYEWVNVLSAFRKLGGSMNKLQGILKNLHSFDQLTLISAFIETDPSFIKQWLLDQLDTPLEQEQQLRYASKLIRLQNRKGLELYFDILKTSRKVTDISAPGNPLYTIHDLSLLDLALEIYQFAYEGDYIHDTFADLKSITTQMLYTLAFSNNNFMAFWVAFNDFLEKLTNEQTIPDEKRQVLLYQAKYWLDGAEHEYYLKDEIPFTLKQAIEITKQLNSRP